MALRGSAVRVRYAPRGFAAFKVKLEGRIFLIMRALYRWAVRTHLRKPHAESGGLFGVRGYV